MKRFILGLLLLLGLATAVLADVPTTATENDPRTNVDANACYIGGSLYGKCGSYDLNYDGKIDVEEIKYMYAAGWFVIRFEKGVILRSQVPVMYRWLIGPEPVPPVVYPPSAPAAPSAPVVPPPACYDNNVGTLYDVQYTGTPNITTNMLRFDSDNGSCTTPIGPSLDYYIVIANSLTEADTACPYITISSAAGYGFMTMPADFYICADF
jgi:hypothetical protein